MSGCPASPDPGWPSPLGLWLLALEEGVTCFPQLPSPPGLGLDPCSGNAGATTGLSGTLSGV